MHVAITGASTGIGEAIAREYGSTGEKLTLVARRRDLLEKLAGEIGGECFVVGADLSQCERACDWIGPAEERHGPIDVLINNAGIEITRAAAETPFDQVAQLFRLNLETPLRLTHAVLPAMLARKDGVIVNVASVAALAPAPSQTWYGGSKAGLAAFSESLRNELRGTGVHVVTVYPGPVTTPMAERAYEAFGGRQGSIGALPEGKPDALARLVRRAVHQRRARVIYPAFYITARLFPWIARWVMDAYAPTPYR